MRSTCWQKVAIILLTLSFFLLKPASVLARPSSNYVGVNIASRYWEFQDAANLVGPGGWVVIIGCPGDAERMAELIRESNVNVIIRGHFPGWEKKYSSNDYDDWAKHWVATLAQMDLGNKKVWFIPWNDVNNLDQNCRLPENQWDGGEAEPVRRYTLALRGYIDQMGLNDKVKLLTPAFNVSNGNCRVNRYIELLGGADYLAQFDGVAANYYDFEGGCGDVPFCSDDYHRNPAKFQEFLNEVGASGKEIFLQETGVVNSETGLSYEDSYLARLVQTAFDRQVWDQGNMAMFSIFSYDPEGRFTWNIFNSQTARIMSQYGHGLGGQVATGNGAPNSETSDSCLNASNQNLKYCASCGGGSPGAEDRSVGKVFTNNSDLIYGRPGLACVANTSYIPDTDMGNAEYWRSLGYGYSIERPYPGNSCHDPADWLTRFDKGQLDPTMVNYCAPAPKLEETISWLPDYHSSGETVTQPTNQFLPDLTDVRLPEYLFNSRASKQYYTNPEVRVSNFLDDYLRGAIAEREVLPVEDSLAVVSQERLQAESGAIKKLTPRGKIHEKKTWDDYVNDLFLRLAKGEIHDWPLAYKCNASKLDTCRMNFVPEDQFNQIVVFPSTKNGSMEAVDRRLADCCEPDSIYPIRLSTLFCRGEGGGYSHHAQLVVSQLNSSGYPNLTVEELCGQTDDWLKLDHWTLYSYLWANYIPTVTRGEDVPMVIDFCVEHGADPSRNGFNPAQDRIVKTTGRFKDLPNSKREEILRAGDGEANGFYYMGPDDGRVDFVGKPYQVCRVEVIYLGGLTSVKDGSHQLWKLLTSKENQAFVRQDKKDDLLALQGSNRKSCTFDGVEYSTSGDQAAMKWEYYAPYEIDPINNQVYRGSLEGREETYLDQTFSCSDPDCVEREVDGIRVCDCSRKSQGSVQTEIPLVDEIAKYLIGTKGVFRALLPEKDIVRIDQQLSEKSPANPLEFPAAGKAYYYYQNGLKNQDLIRKAKICRDGPDLPEPPVVNDPDVLEEYENRYNAAIGEWSSACDDAREESGQSGANPEAAVYFPYLGAVKEYWDRLAREALTPMGVGSN